MRLFHRSDQAIPSQGLNRNHYQFHPDMFGLK